MNKYHFSVNGIIHTVTATTFYAARQILNEELGYG